MLPHYQNQKSMVIDDLCLWRYQWPDEGYGNKNLIGSFGQTAMIMIRDLFPNDPIILVGLGGSGTMYSIGTYFSTDEANVFHMFLDRKRDQVYPEDAKVVMLDDDIVRGRTVKRVMRRLVKFKRKLDAIVVYANNTRCYNGHTDIIMDGDRKIPILSMHKKE